MKITRRQLNKLIERLLHDENKSFIFEGVTDYAAKKALILYIEHQNEADLKKKIFDLAFPGNIAQVRAGLEEAYSEASGDALVKEAFNRTTWWWKKLSALIDKTMLVRFANLFFDDRDKLFNEVASFIKKHYNSLKNEYMSTFTEEDIAKLKEDYFYRWHGPVDEDDDMETETRDEELKTGNKEALEEVLSNPVFFMSPKGIVAILNLAEESEVIDQMNKIKEKSSDSGILVLIMKGIWDFVKS